MLIDDDQEELDILNKAIKKEIFLQYACGPTE